MFRNEIVLIVAAHADDEVLGCGGAIAKHTARGDSVHLLLMADGVSSRQQLVASSAEERNKALHRAADILGVKTITQASLADNQLDTISLLELTRVIENEVDRIAPAIVYTHHFGDLNVDHRCTQQAVMTACRPQPLHPVRRILGFEVLSSTEWNTPQQCPFSPNYFMDISGYLSTKLAALEAYSTEMRIAPHSRSIEHSSILARHRGYSVGVDACEAFEVYRWIES
jgi:LmbE family N-acetylglucosaminyl deacetylase